MLNHNIKVLIVSDMAVVRKIFRLDLKDIGYEDVFEAADVQHALERLNIGGYKLIIADCKMPGMEGIGLAEAIRKSPDKKIREISLIVITSQCDKDTALKAGASGFLAKPFTPKELEEEITNIAGRDRSLLQPEL